MEIKMPVKFHGSYVVVTRSEGKEKKERCQKLTIRELSEKEKGKSHESLDPEQMPTHQITFYDFGCKRLLDGKMKENEEERVVFQVQDKEYEFSPFKPSR
jgi:hypothetical protein